MLTMHTELPLLTTPAILEPPRGYRPLAWLGLVANSVAIPLGLAVILLDPTWRVVHIAVGAGAALPAAVVGIVAALALLSWRAWGQVLAIIALSMSLAVDLAYGIVRLALVAEVRTVLAVALPLLWAANVAILLYWCRPAIRSYLR
jgi:hypothetical protein